ncbi:hypothetical protein [Chitinophaga sp. XS-30]|uniref:hypothetical protein n=1 Tax=Chitinophaga sp. XS-30 TaxID=2604421 RepID=UPI0011DE2D0D|nr:hypothetical protein [Chitinophaga sp. XS-30]QEH42992.1 hypothetical protein FW415_19810 [Chitinophaga sp. XS-30]
MTKYTLLLLSMVLLAGCSKKSDNPAAPGTYYLRFKADGVQKEYKAHTLAQLYYDPENLSYHCNMTSSLKTAELGKDALSLFLLSKTAYKTGERYHLRNEIEMPKTNAIMPQVMISMFTESGKPYTAQFLPVTGLQFDDAAEVKFTEITDKYVRGTFSGLAFSMLPERAELKVTDGEFYLAVYK